VDERRRRLAAERVGIGGAERVRHGDQHDARQRAPVDCDGEPARPLLGEGDLRDCRDRAEVREIPPTSVGFDQLSLAPQGGATFLVLEELEGYRHLP
jgi:hypothetical protein